eukprot:UN33742
MFNFFFSIYLPLEGGHSQYYHTHFYHQTFSFCHYSLFFYIFIFFVIPFVSQHESSFPLL